MGIVAFLIYCVICGGVCAAIANSKGRDGMTWFIVGLFLGLIGVLCAGFIAPANQRS